MNVTTTNELYDEFEPIWRKCRDAVRGNEAIKKGRELYYPMFNPVDKERYDFVLKRGYFNEVSGRTVEGMKGAIFRKPPSATPTPNLEYMTEDADGMGLSIDQLAKASVAEVLTVGREGIFADMPPVPEGATRAQVNELYIRPYLSKYAAESILDWDVKRVGGKTMLSLVKLKEVVKVRVDDFTVTEKNQYRLLTLKEEGATVRVINVDGTDVSDPYVLRKADQTPFKYIPFFFIGAEDNRPAPKMPPLSGIVEINIAQYRNILDHEENIYMQGQLTAGVTSSMTDSQWQQHHGSGFTLGSSKVHFLGPEGAFHTMQVPANSALAVEIKEKNERMVSLGARLITPSNANETLDAVALRAGAETSQLHTIAGNVSEAYEAALEACALYVGDKPEDVLFSLNREFFDSKLSAQEIMAIIQLADRGDIAQSDVRWNIRKAGYLDDDRTDEMIDDENKTNPPGI